MEILYNFGGNHHTAKSVGSGFKVFKSIVLFSYCSPIVLEQCHFAIDTDTYIFSPHS